MTKRVSDQPMPLLREAQLWERKGILGWWFALTAPPRRGELASLEAREYIRKGELISLVSVLVAAFLLSLTQNSLSDPSTAMAVFLMAVALVVALMVNRLGKVTLAAYIIIVSMMLVVMLSLLGARGGLRLIWFTTFDLFCFPIYLSAQIIHRRAALYTGLVSVVFVWLYYVYEPHALLSGYGAHNFDELLYEINQPYFSWFALINRNIGLLAVASIFSWLGGRSYAWAMALGEQARNERDIASAVALYRQKSEHDLLQFLQEVKTAFASHANGQLLLLQDRPNTDPLRGVALFLNAQLKRIDALQRRPSFSSASSAEFLKQEVLRLVHLLDAVVAGEMPIQALDPDATDGFSSRNREVSQLGRLIFTLLYFSQLEEQENDEKGLFPPGRETKK